MRLLLYAAFRTHNVRPSSQARCVNRGTNFARRSFAGVCCTADDGHHSSAHSAGLFVDDSDANLERCCANDSDVNLERCGANSMRLASRHSRHCDDDDDANAQGGSVGSPKVEACIAGASLGGEPAGTCPNSAAQSSPHCRLKSPEEPGRPARQVEASRAGACLSVPRSADHVVSIQAVCAAHEVGQGQVVGVGQQAAKMLGETGEKGAEERGEKGAEDHRAEGDERSRPNGRVELRACTADGLVHSARIQRKEHGGGGRPRAVAVGGQHMHDSNSVVVHEQAPRRRTLTLVNVSPTPCIADSDSASGSTVVAANSPCALAWSGILKGGGAQNGGYRSFRSPSPQASTGRSLEIKERPQTRARSVEYPAMVLVEPGPSASQERSRRQDARSQGRSPHGFMPNASPEGPVKADRSRSDTGAPHEVHLVSGKSAVASAMAISRYYSPSRRSRKTSLGREDQGSSELK